jgi:hypothetical protein
VVVSNRNSWSSSNRTRCWCLLSSEGHKTTSVVLAHDAITQSSRTLDWRVRTNAVSTVITLIFRSTNTKLVSGSPLIIFCLYVVPKCSIYEFYLKQLVVSWPFMVTPVTWVCAFATATSNDKANNKRRVFILRLVVAMRSGRMKNQPSREWHDLHSWQAILVERPTRSRRLFVHCSVTWSSVALWAEERHFCFASWGWCDLQYFPWMKVCVCLCSFCTCFLWVLVCSVCRLYLYHCMKEHAGLFRVLELLWVLDVWNSKVFWWNTKLAMSVCCEVETKK